MKHQKYLTLAGVMSSLIGLLHLVIIFSGPDAYLYFGAGKEMADGDAAGSIIPDLVTLGVAVVFFVFAAYAFSGAGLIRPLFGLKKILIIISLIFLLRGLVVMADLAVYLTTPGYPFRNIVFSVVSLVTGIFYFLGFIYLRIATKQKRPA
jgi:putative oxidoreductase